MAEKLNYRPVAVYRQNHFFKVEDLGSAVQSALFHINNIKWSFSRENLLKAIFPKSDKINCDITVLNKEKNYAKIKIDYPHQHVTDFIAHIQECASALSRFSRNGFSDWIPGDSETVKAYTPDTDLTFDEKKTKKPINPKKDATENDCIEMKPIIGQDWILRKINELTSDFSKKSVEEIEQAFYNIFPKRTTKISIKDGLVFVFTIFGTLFEAKNAERLTDLFNIVLSKDNLQFMENLDVNPIKDLDPCIQLIFILIGVLQWAAPLNEAFDQLSSADQKFNKVLGANKQDCIRHIERIENHLDDICSVMQERYTFFKKKKYSKIHVTLDELLLALQDFMHFIKSLSIKLDEHLRDLQKRKFMWSAAYVASICAAVTILVYTGLNYFSLSTLAKQTLLGGFIVSGNLTIQIRQLRGDLQIAINRQSEILTELKDLHTSIQEMSNKTRAATGKTMEQMRGMKDEMKTMVREFKRQCVDIRKVFENADSSESTKD